MLCGALERPIGGWLFRLRGVYSSFCRKKRWRTRILGNGLQPSNCISTRIRGAPQLGCCRRNCSARFFGDSNAALGLRPQFLYFGSKSLIPLNLRLKCFTVPYRRNSRSLISKIDKPWLLSACICSRKISSVARPIMSLLFCQYFNELRSKLFAAFGAKTLSRTSCFSVLVLHPLESGARFSSASAWDLRRDQAIALLKH